MFSSTSSPKLLLDDIYKSSLEAIDRNAIDDQYVYPLDFIDPLTDWQTDTFESVAADYICDFLPPPSSNEHIEMDIANGQPSVQLEDYTISVFNEEANSNRKDLGFSFDKKRKGKQPDLSRSCKPRKYSSLPKQCIRFLNDINNHKIHQPLSYTNNYDKLASHHVVAERKRREQMTDLFSDLRALVPVKPKNAGRARVLLQTKDYVIHLKKSVEQLERRNRELEALLCQKS